MDEQTTTLTDDEIQSDQYRSEVADEEPDADGTDTTDADSDDTDADADDTDAS